MNRKVMTLIVVGIVVALVFGGGLLLISSGNGTTDTGPQVISLGDEVTLKVGETVFIGGATTFTLDKVLTDSRCPTDVECIQAGEIKVAMDFVFNLFNDSFTLKQRNDVYAKAGIGIQIIDVAPEPISTEVLTGEQYRVTFLIERAEITHFFDCVAAGNPVMESYPRQCNADGNHFVEDIGNGLEKTDLIWVTTPRPNAQVGEFIDIHGEARGHWFFEGDFPVRLVDKEGDELATGIAQSVGEWMTEEFVPFVAQINYTPKKEMFADLILEKDNPSDLRELDDMLRVPVILVPQ